jgi:hypothetical protein
MHFKNYERPKGWTKGAPEVLVSGFAAWKLGEPLVDYDSLHQFLTDDLGIPYEQKTAIKLYGAFPKSRALGFHIPYTRTIHVNAIAAEHRFSREGGTMRIIAHEARHRSDSTNKRLLTAAEIIPRWVSYKAGFELSQHLPLLDAAPVIGAFAARRTYYELEPAEKRAMFAEKSAAAIAHEQDILFPRSDRTAFLELTNNLSNETVESLGRLSVNGDIEPRIEDLSE